MSSTGMIVIASAVLIQGGMMSTYIRLSRNARKAGKDLSRVD